MMRRDYNDYLYRTSLERVAHARTSQAISTLLLDKARATLERSRLQVSHQPTLEQIWFDVAAVVAQEPETRRVQGPPNLMERVAERVFENEAVALDGRHFVDCTLRDCTLEYAGYPVVLERTQFSGCRFQFLGQAAMTMQLLETLGYLDSQGTQQGEASASAPHASLRPN